MLKVSFISMPMNTDAPTGNLEDGSRPGSVQGPLGLAEDTRRRKNPADVHASGRSRIFGYRAPSPPIADVIWRREKEREKERRPRDFLVSLAEQERERESTRRPPPPENRDLTRYAPADPYLPRGCKQSLPLDSLPLSLSLSLSLSFRLAEG